MSSPQVLRTKAELRRVVAALRQTGESVALVPTMGALHEGHLALVRRAQALCRHVCVSIFVNPTQFAPMEDFSAYPRDEASDLAKLDATGCGLVYAPSLSEMYPPGFETAITVGGPAQGLCAETRPHFFGGVALVVAKLLLQCMPDVAVFGEKDYQQLLVIRRLVRDLDIPVAIEGAPIVRASDGVALSSRNAYLTPAERQIAPTLYQTLCMTAEMLTDRSVPVETVLTYGRNTLLRSGFASVDYFALREAESLAPVTQPGPHEARLLAAAWLGKARLIDNVPVSLSP